MLLSERESQIYEAIELIRQAQELVDDTIDGTSEMTHYEAYGRYGFDQLLGNGNPYDSSLMSLMEEMKKGDE